MGLRGTRVPRLPGRDLGLLGRPLPSGRGRGGARAGGPADARLQPLLQRGDGPAGPAPLGVQPRRAGLLQPTPAPRPTSARSRSPASTPTPAASSSRRSSASSATSTGAPTARCRRPRGWRRTRPSGRCCRAFARCRSTMPGALREAVDERTAAVLIEPLQGEAGVYPLSDETLLAAREACDASGALLIFDEVQTGMGRTGSLWAYEQTPVRPDVLTTAKALGGGMPIGACVTSPQAGERARERRSRLHLRRRPARRHGGAGGARRRRRTGAAARGSRHGRAAAPLPGGPGRGAGGPGPGIDDRSRPRRQGSTPPRLRSAFSRRG